MLDEVTLLEVKLVLEFEYDEFDYCVDELCVEDELTVLLVDGSVTVEVEMLVEELVEDEV